MRGPPAGRYTHVPVALFDTTPPREDWLRVAATLLDALATALTRFETQGFAAFADRWNALNLHAGLPVEVQGDLHTLSGTCLGVDHDGALRLDCGDRIERVLAGDVSLRAVQAS